jgi:hypothetical protein
MNWTAGWQNIRQEAVRQMTRWQHIIDKGKQLVDISTYSRIVDRSEAKYWTDGHKKIYKRIAE